MKRKDGNWKLITFELNRPNVSPRRPPLCNPSYTANADMLYPKLPKGRSISIGSRHKTRKPGSGPGLIYNITVSHKA